MGMVISVCAIAGGMDPCPGASDYDCEVFDFESTYDQVTSLSLSGSGLRQCGLYGCSNRESALCMLTRRFFRSVKSGHIIDSSTDVGHYSSLVVDANGPHIGYYDQHTHDFQVCRD